MEASAVDLSPDRLHTLLEDGEFVPCRSRDAADTTLPSRSVLVVMTRSTHPRPQTVQMLEHEHSLRDELNPAWAIRSLALRTHEGRTALNLEDPGGELLGQRVGKPMDVADVLRVGAGAAAALRQLHGRGLIHKDLKPTNVMIDLGTGQVWLRGFGLASRVPRERRAPESPEVIAGTLAYMAPEQTGWMNRSIDARSDLYALGVVLYELSTGSLPFTASDAMGWVHGHIAQRPVPPAERRHGLPEVLSAIVMKLLAKTAEDRYQTAAGVEHDLRRGLAQWEAAGRINAFPLAEHDTPDRLVIPEKLYGRAREIETLLGAFERVVTSGTAELVLVSGYAGIGKSSVVNELHKVLVPPRGLFASGKFDQYKRDIPYATLAQAFQRLVQYLLGQSDAELSGWRDALVEALGPSGRLMIDLVPDLKLIIGDQPPVPEIRQPIAALMIDATACLRALADNRVDVPEARRAASRIVKEGTWADDHFAHECAVPERHDPARACRRQRHDSGHGRPAAARGCGVFGLHSDGARRRPSRHSRGSCPAAAGVDEPDAECDRGDEGYWRRPDDHVAAGTGTQATDCRERHGRGPSDRHSGHDL